MSDFRFFKASRRDEILVENMFSCPMACRRYDHPLAPFASGIFPKGDKKRKRIFWRGILPVASLTGCGVLEIADSTNISSLTGRTSSVLCLTVSHPQLSTLNSQLSTLNSQLLYYTILYGVAATMAVRFCLASSRIMAGQKPMGSGCSVVFPLLFLYTRSLPLVFAGGGIFFERMPLMHE